MIVAAIYKLHVYKQLVLYKEDPSKHKRNAVIHCCCSSCSGSYILLGSLFTSGALPSFSEKEGRREKFFLLLRRPLSAHINYFECPRKAGKFKLGAARYVITALRPGGSHTTTFRILHVILH